MTGRGGALKLRLGPDQATGEVILLTPTDRLRYLENRDAGDEDDARPARTLGPIYLSPMPDLPHFRARWFREAAGGAGGGAPS